jgi:hypothetical protein
MYIDSARYSQAFPTRTPHPGGGPSGLAAAVCANSSERIGNDLGSPYGATGQALDIRQLLPRLFLLIGRRPHTRRTRGCVRAICASIRLTSLDVAVGTALRPGSRPSLQISMAVFFFIGEDRSGLTKPIAVARGGRAAAVQQIYAHLAVQFSPKRSADARL